MERKRLLPILWTIAIAILSIIPPPYHGPEVPKLLDAGHVISYALLTILWIWSLGNRYSALLVSFATTPLTELVQIPIPWRSANIIDVFNNIMGVLIGIVIFSILERYRLLS